MDKAELQKLWEDPANWTRWSYRCAHDPRLVVPKRRPMLGWTVNAAHGWKAIFVLIGAVAIALSGPALLIATEGFQFRAIDAFHAIFASAALLIIFCTFFARHPR